MKVRNLQKRLFLVSISSYMIFDGIEILLITLNYSYKHHEHHYYLIALKSMFMFTSKNMKHNNVYNEREFQVYIWKSFWF